MHQRLYTKSPIIRQPFCIIFSRTLFFLPFFFVFCIWLLCCVKTMEKCRWPRFSCLSFVVWNGEKKKTLFFHINNNWLQSIANDYVKTFSFFNHNLFHFKLFNLSIESLCCSIFMFFLFEFVLIVDIIYYGHTRNQRVLRQWIFIRMKNNVLRFFGLDLFDMFFFLFLFDYILYFITQSFYRIDYTTIILILLFFITIYWVHYYRLLCFVWFCFSNPFSVWLSHQFWSQHIHLSPYCYFITYLIKYHLLLTSILNILFYFFICESIHINSTWLCHLSYSEKKNIVCFWCKLDFIHSFHFTFELVNCLLSGENSYYMRESNAEKKKKTNENDK